MEDVIKPLDGGWGWVIVTGAAVKVGLSHGFSKAYTLIYDDMLTRFGETDFNTSLIMTIFLALTFFIGAIICTIIFKMNACTDIVNINV